MVLDSFFSNVQQPHSEILSRQDAKAQSDGLRPVIPSKCEGSKKDFSRSVEMTKRFLLASFAALRESSFSDSVSQNPTENFKPF